MQVDDVVTGQVSQCSRLTVLSLRNNNLSSLPPEIGNMHSLRVLDVIGNKYNNNYNSNNNNYNTQDDIYSAVIMTEVIARVHSLHLVNVE